MVRHWMTALACALSVPAACACDGSAPVVASSAACNVGDQQCNGQHREQCSSSGAWERRTCEEGTWCQPDGQGGVNCVEVDDDCTPDCSGKGCGDNGCGGNCGACGLNQTCDETNATCTCKWEGDPAAGTCCNEGQVWTSGGCCTETCGCENRECGCTNCGRPCFDAAAPGLEDGCPDSFRCDSDTPGLGWDECPVRSSCKRYRCETDTDCLGGFVCQDSPIFSDWKMCWRECQTEADCPSGWNCTSASSLAGAGDGGFDDGSGDGGDGGYDDGGYDDGSGDEVLFCYELDY